METLGFRLEIKDLSNSGTFSGFASVYGVTDLGGDVVAPGAFTKSLRDRGNEVPLLFSHDLARPVGLGILTDTAKGLQIDGKLTLAAPDGRTAYELMLDRVIKGLSIGYKTVRDEMKNGVRHLRELALFEVSLVTVPMNPYAQITSLKTVGAAEIAELKSLFLRYRIQQKGF